MQKAPWIDKRTNENSLMELTGKQLLWENLVTAKIERKRARGKQRRILEGITRWLGQSNPNDTMSNDVRRLALSTSCSKFLEKLPIFKKVANLSFVHPNIH